VFYAVKLSHSAHPWKCKRLSCHTKLMRCTGVPNQCNFIILLIYMCTWLTFYHGTVYHIHYKADAIHSLEIRTPNTTFYFVKLTLKGLQLLWMSKISISEVIKFQEAPLVGEVHTFQCKYYYTCLSLHVLH
jgi:hypothetical protein